jgi:hypothetical protein
MKSQKRATQKPQKPPKSSKPPKPQKPSNPHRFGGQPLSSMIRRPLSSVLQHSKTFRKSKIFLENNKINKTNK